MGVDEKLFAPRKQPQLLSQLGIKANEFVIGFVGRFVPEKGILTLIKSLANFKYLSWKLLLLGRGILQEQIETTATELDIKDRLIIVESVSHDKVFSLH